MRAPKHLETTCEKLPHLIDALRNARNLLIVTHDNPDPDCIASSFGLQYIAQSIARVSCKIAYGGMIGRRENRAMVQHLGFNMTHTDSIDWDAFDMIAAVDYQPRQNWRRLPGNRLPSIIIDHHPRRHIPGNPLFVDIRKGFGANSTIMTQYLMAAHAKISHPLATGLLYGIVSDTQHFARGATDDDLHAYLHLFALCNHTLLSQIIHPQIDVLYLRDFWRGFHAARQFGSVITSFIGTMCVPDLISDVADRMVSIIGVQWVLVMGVHDDTMYLSLRSRNTRRDAGELIRKLVGRRGSAGGHGFMAGGQIRVLKPAAPDVLAGRLSNQFVRLILGKHAASTLPMPLIEEANGIDYSCSIS